MKRWEKLLARAPRADRDRVESVIKMILAGKFPADTIKLQDSEEYRTRVGDWRIKFHYKNGCVTLDYVRRRNDNTYKQ